jgi:hypothetical protein
MGRVMGRSNPQTLAGLTPAGARSAPDPLDELLIPAGPHPSDGYLVVLPSALAAELPHRWLKEERVRVLARTVPAERRRLYGQLFRRVWISGETHTENEWARVLTEDDGLSQADLGRVGGEGSPITPEHLRMEAPKFAHRLKLCMWVYDGRKRGMGRPPNREALTAWVQSLIDRADSIDASADGAALHGQAWLSGQLPRAVVENLSRGRKRVLFALLHVLGKGKSRAKKEDEITVYLAEERLTMGDWHGTKSTTAIAGPGLRVVFHDARAEHGLPVASSTAGYWISDENELSADGDRQRGRATSIRWHVKALAEAAALMWPETPEEGAAAARAVAAEDIPAPLDWSEEYQRKASAKAAAKVAAQQARAEARAARPKKARKLTMADYRRMASVCVEDMRPRAERLLRGLRGARREDVLDTHDNDLLDEFLEGARFAAGGPLPPPDRDWPRMPARRTTAKPARRPNGSKKAGRRYTRTSAATAAGVIGR